MTDLTTVESNKQPIFQKAPKLGAETITSSTGTELVSVYTAGMHGALIDNLCVTTTSASSMILSFKLQKGEVVYPLSDIQIAAGSGVDGMPPSNPLRELPCVQSGGGLPLGPEIILLVGIKSALSEGESVTILAFGGDY